MKYKYNNDIDDEIDELLDESFIILKEDEDNSNQEEGEQPEESQEETGEGGEENPDNGEGTEENAKSSENNEEQQNSKDNSTQEEGEQPEESQEETGEGGEENPDNGEGTEENTEANMQAKEEEIAENKEKYNYFIMFQDLYNTLKFFIDKLTDIINKTNEEDEYRKTLLREVSFMLFDLKEDFEYLLLNKIDILSIESLSTIYISLTSKTKILIELVEKITNIKKD